MSPLHISECSIHPPIYAPILFFNLSIHQPCILSFLLSIFLPNKRKAILTYPTSSLPIYLFTHKLPPKLGLQFLESLCFLWSLIHTVLPAQGVSFPSLSPENFYSPFRFWLKPRPHYPQHPHPDDILVTWSIISPPSKLQKDRAISILLVTCKRPFKKYLQNGLKGR